MPLGARTRTDPHREGPGRPASEPQRWAPLGERLKSFDGSFEFFIAAKHVQHKVHHFKHVQFRGSRHRHPSGTSHLPKLRLAPWNARPTPSSAWAPGLSFLCVPLTPLGPHTRAVPRHVSFCEHAVPQAQLSFLRPTSANLNCHGGCLGVSGVARSLSGMSSWGGPSGLTMARVLPTQVKRNLLSVSYHLAQYTDVISDLHGKIERLKSKIERQEQEKKREPGVRDARGRAQRRPGAARSRGAPF